MAPGVPAEVYRCVPNSSIGETMARTLDITTAWSNGPPWQASR
jgi:hypothetical protein